MYICVCVCPYIYIYIYIYSVCICVYVCVCDWVCVCVNNICKQYKQRDRDSQVQRFNRFCSDNKGFDKC